MDELNDLHRASLFEGASLGESDSKDGKHSNLRKAGDINSGLKRLRANLNILNGRAIDASSILGLMTTP